MADAIIVLGRGIKSDGSLPADAKSRVKKAVELWQKGAAKKVIMSGAWSYHMKDKPNITEAKAMYYYANQLGLDEDSIVTEEKSVDTATNVYFTKKDICEPRRWRDIIVVASDDHMRRVQYLFDKICGPKYLVTFIVSDRVLDDESYEIEIEHEANSMKLTEKWLDSIEPGDDEAIWDIILKNHPAFAGQGSTQ